MTKNKPALNADAWSRIYNKFVKKSRDDGIYIQYSNTHTVMLTIGYIRRIINAELKRKEE